MKWIDRLNECIDYVEDHLHQEIELDRLCEITCLSRPYFLRMFEAACGISCTQYIRNRRLTRAASELQSGAKVIDAALQAGYQSSESFSRAFKSFHGISPSKVRQAPVQLVSYPRLAFQVKIIGGESMNYQIVNKEPFQAIGVSIITQDSEGNNVDIGNLWNRLIQDQTVSTLSQISTTGSVYGVCFPTSPNSPQFRYAVAALTDETPSNTPYEVMSIPTAQWAIFQAKGTMPDVIGELWDQILSQWLPSTEYEIDHAIPDIENYIDGGIEIWLPIR